MTGPLLQTAVLGALLLASCTPDVKAFEPAGQDTGPMFEGVGSSAIGPALARLSTKAGALVDATSGSAGGGSDREAAQEAWRETMAVWQELEAMKLGPAASSGVDPGGEDLGQRIYSWPTISPCRVDIETLAGRWDDENFFATALVDAYGLDALEHLLFAGEDHACGGRSGDGPDAQWDELGAEGVATARAAYAGRLAADVEAQAEALAGMWAAGETGFAAQLASAGDDESPYSSQTVALAALVDALDYQRVVVDRIKLGGPLGFNACGEDPLLATATELPVSGQSLAAVQANLTGFGALFTGGDGPGLDDFLTEAGHGEVATAITQALSASEQAAGAIEGTLEAALTDAPEAVQALHDAQRALSSALAEQLPQALGVEPPLVSPCAE